MKQFFSFFAPIGKLAALAILFFACATFAWPPSLKVGQKPKSVVNQQVSVRYAVRQDISPPMAPSSGNERHEFRAEAPTRAPESENDAELQDATPSSSGPVLTVPRGSEAVEQKTPGDGPPVQMVESFDGLGEGFTGPQGSARFFNPSDNSLAVGRDHIFQI